MESGTPVPAAKEIPTSPLLALPSELRIKIYKDLLYPGPFIEDVLYTEIKHRPGKEHEADEEDRRNEESTANIEKGDYGRIDYGTTPADYGFGWLQPSNSCGIDPSILRVNRQIHDEGVSFLYKNISSRFRFGQDLRSWSIQRYLMQEYRSSYAIRGNNSSSHMDCVILCTRHYNSRSDNQSDLSLHCLRWVSDINIDIAWEDILGLQNRGWESMYQHDRELDITPEGKLILDVLRYLNQTSAPNSLARGLLHMTLNGVRWGSFAKSLEDSNASTWSRRSRLMDTRKKEGIAQMITLLRSLRRLRGVTVRDGLWTYENNRGDMLYVNREVDLDSLEWIKT